MKIVITGGCKGLGLSFSKFLANEKNTVYSLYNTSQENAKVLERDYSNIKTIKCDIRNEKDIEGLLTKIDDIDILINNASIAIDNEYYNKSKEEFMNVLETNVVGTFLMTKHLSKRINNGGGIINISSNNTLGNNSVLSMDYDASKAGINMLTKDFALALDNIKVLAYAPGWIDTDAIREMNPLYLEEEMKKVNQSKLIDPDELARYIMNDYKNHNTGSIIEVKEL